MEISSLELRPLVAAVVLLIGAAGARAQTPAGGATPSGKAIYEQRCVQCHGADGRGDGAAAPVLNPVKGEGPEGHSPPAGAPSPAGQGTASSPDGAVAAAPPAGDQRPPGEPDAIHREFVKITEHLEAGTVTEAALRVFIKRRQDDKSDPWPGKSGDTGKLSLLQLQAILAWIGTQQQRKISVFSGPTVPTPTGD